MSVLFAVCLFAHISRTSTRHRFVFAVCHSRLQLIILIVIVIWFGWHVLWNPLLTTESMLQLPMAVIESTALASILNPAILLGTTCYWLVWRCLAKILMIFMRMQTCVTCLFFLEHVCDVSEHSHVPYNITCCHFTFILLDNLWFLLLTLVGF